LDCEYLLVLKQTDAKEINFERVGLLEFFSFGRKWNEIDWSRAEDRAITIV